MFHVKGFRNIIIFFMAFCCTGVISAKVLIMTHCYNRPEFIPWQHGTFKKFLCDDYEFVVFNDASDLSIFQQTQAVCQQLDIRCIPVPQSIHYGRNNPSVECGDTIQYMMNTMGFDHEGIVLLVDSDMFLIRKFNIEKFLKDYEIAAHPQSRDGVHGPVPYLLPNLMFFNMQTLKDKRTLNFDLGEIDGVRTDTAGFTYYYLMAHPALKWLKTNYYPFLDENNPPVDSGIVATFKSTPSLWKMISFNKFDYEFYIDFTFLHFRAGSNWYKMEEGRWSEKRKLLEDALEGLIANPQNT